MKKLILFFLIIIMSFTGCKTVMMRMYGVKKPMIENKNTLLSYAVEIGLDTSNMAALRIADDFNSVISRRGLPDGILFDASGDNIEYKQSDTSCNAGLFPFIKSLQKNEQYKKSDEFNLQKELDLLGTLNGQPLQPYEPDYDFLLFIYWAKWEGKLNEDHVKEWQILAANNKNVRIKTILVNLDIQEYWEKGKRDELLKAMRKSIY